MPAMVWKLTRLRTSPVIKVEGGIQALRAIPQPFSHNISDPGDPAKGFPNADAEMYDTSILDILLPSSRAVHTPPNRLPGIYINLLLSQKVLPT